MPQGRLITIYDPATGRDVNGVWTRDPFPGNSSRPIASRRPREGDLQYYPDPERHHRRASRRGSRTSQYPEHFNKDVFWNWVGKVDHNFSANDRAFFRWGENERNEVRNTSAIRSGPAQDGQLPLWRANRALVGDWVHMFGAGTVFNLRGSYTYFLEWSYSDEALGFDATQLAGPRVSFSSCQAADRRDLPASSTMDEFVQPVARLGTEPEQDLHPPAEHLAEPRRAQHPQRSRRALDQRLQPRTTTTPADSCSSPATSRAAR